jgi:hypothetical protein
MSSEDKAWLRDAHAVKDDDNDPPIRRDCAKVEAEAEYGPLPIDVSDAAHARRWRLIVAAKLRRLYERGRCRLN